MPSKPSNKADEHWFSARLPADVWEALNASAGRNLRSINGELIWILREHLRLPHSSGKASGGTGKKKPK